MTIREEQRKASYAFIDICKVICIFLIVMNHLSGSYEHINYMKSFRIPLFFFGAGFLFVYQKYSGIGAFLTEKIKRLILPYFLFCFLYLCYRYVPLYLSQEVFPMDVFFKHVIGMFYSVGSAEWMVAIPLWFLTCLFVVESIYFLIARHFDTTSQVLGVLLGLSIIGYAFYFYDIPRLPWNMEIALMALPFFAAGHLGRSHVIKWIQMSKFERLTLGVLFMALNYLGSLSNGFVDLNGRVYGDYLLFFMNGITGIAGVIFLATLIPNWGVFKFYGRNTLAILGFHGFATLFVVRVAALVYGSSVWALVPLEWVGLMVSIGIFIVLAPVIWFCNRYVPWIVGKQKKAEILQIHDSCCTLEPMITIGKQQGDVT